MEHEKTEVRLNMIARMRLGAAGTTKPMKVEAVIKIVEELERMGWQAHMEYDYDDTWALVFTREIEPKELRE